MDHEIKLNLSNPFFIKAGETKVVESLKTLINDSDLVRLTVTYSVVAEASNDYDCGRGHLMVFVGTQEDLDAGKFGENCFALRAINPQLDFKEQVFNMSVIKPPCQPLVVALVAVCTEGAYVLRLPEVGGIKSHALIIRGAGRSLPLEDDSVVLTKERFAEVFSQTFGTSLDDHDQGQEMYSGIFNKAWTP